MIGSQTKAEVRERARNACEYCGLHQDDSPLAALHIEHIIPKVHGGSDDLDNLALACVDCNLHKGTNLTGIDPETTAVTQLFHPRYKWSGEDRKTRSTAARRDLFGTLRTLRPSIAGAVRFPNKQRT